MMYDSYEYIIALGVVQADEVDEADEAQVLL